jgi:hypothetical protein
VERYQNIEKLFQGTNFADFSFPDKRSANCSSAKQQNRVSNTGDKREN